MNSPIITAVLIAFSLGNLVLADEKDKKEAPKIEKRSVSARMVRSVGEGTGIRAKKVPGEFSVPKGSTARNFKYKFNDPDSKIKLDKLTASSIYSVTEKRYITEAANNPNLELPAGKYKFVVGGRPGAYGSLSFDVGPPKVGGGAKAVDHKLPKKFEVSTNETYYVSKDGEQTKTQEISKAKPLKLAYNNGHIAGEHETTVSTSPSPNTKYQSYWKTTIDARLEKGVLSGKYVQYSTFSDCSDPTIPGGFMCNKETMTGHISGKVDEAGRLRARVSGWTRKAFEHPYGSKGSVNGPPKLYEVKPWREDKNTYPLDFTLEFELQLPVKKTRK